MGNIFKNCKFCNDDPIYVTSKTPVYIVEHDHLSERESLMANTSETQSVPDIRDILFSDE